MKESTNLLSYGYTGGGITHGCVFVVLKREDGTTTGSLLLSLGFRDLPGYGKDQFVTVGLQKKPVTLFTPASLESLLFLQGKCCMGAADTWKMCQLSLHRQLALWGGKHWVHPRAPAVPVLMASHGETPNQTWPQVPSEGKAPSGSSPAGLLLHTSNKSFFLLRIFTVLK